MSNQNITITQVEIYGPHRLCRLHEHENDITLSAIRDRDGVWYSSFSDKFKYKDLVKLEKYKAQDIEAAYQKFLENE